MSATKRKKYVTKGRGVPKTAAPISQAVVLGAVCYISGQLPVNAEGVLLRGSVAMQAKRTLDNLISVARAAGFEAADIVYVDVALIKISDLDVVNKLFAKAFRAGKRPARTVYQAAALPLGSQIKLQAIAHKA